MASNWILSSLALVLVAGCSTPTPPETAADQTMDSRTQTTVTKSQSETSTPSDMPVTTTPTPVPPSAYTNGTTTPAPDPTTPANRATSLNNGATNTDPNGNTTSPAPSRPDADNTRVNKRDSKGTTLTPMDQGNSDADLNTTRQIRQGVMGSSSLSFMAKNVKIITAGGHVTLRGAVKTDAERATIEAIAKKTAGDGQVDNQIEVKR